MTIRHNGMDFPEAPRINGYLDLPGSGSPQVSNRWHRVTGQVVTMPAGQNMTGDIDFLWRGSCMFCGNGIWSCPQDDQIILPNYLTADHTACEVTDSNDPAITYRACQRCTADEGGVVRVGRGSNDTNKGLIEWPELLVGPMGDARSARDKQRVEWTDARPTAPAEGAYIRVAETGALARFEKFKDGKVVTEMGSVHEIDEVQVLIPAIYGIMHPQVVIMPFLSSGSNSTQAWAVNRWSGLNVTVVRPGDTKTLTANGIAVPAPCVDPETESAEARLARLEWALERVKLQLHHRMVAEGTARDWCSQFDPILDSSGLAPRRAQQYYLLTMRVKTEHILDDNAQGKLLDTGWRNTFTYQSLSCVEVTPEFKSERPMLSL